MILSPRIPGRASRLLPWLAGLACAVALAGCGGGSAGNAGEETTAAAAAAQPEGGATATGLVSVDTVMTRFGAVKGNVYTGGFEFLGIPFAKPPVGALRWRPPMDPMPWTSVLATQAFRPACPQMRFAAGQDTGTAEGDEDCLQLNVWTPGASGTASLPVMVFIHGGGQQQGSAGEVQGGTQIYNGRNLAARGHAVVVTIQYRLGPLGYLVHPGLEAESGGTSGNYGVMDQIQALKWVRDNIAAFGGDPGRVMVFGQSAGAVNVGNLLASPLATGLFQRAALESGGPVLGTYAGAKSKGIAFVDSLVARGTDTQKIAALRTRDWHTIIAGETPPVDGGVVQMDWQPVVDGVVFKTDPASAFASGQFNHVPLLLGSTADEMSRSVPPGVEPASVRALIAALVPVAYRDQALQLYPPGNTADEAKNSYAQILTDSQFTTLARRTARAVAPKQQDPVWRYFFSHRQSGALAQLGSYHGIDLFYVFNTWENTPYAQAGGFSADDGAVQAQALQYWVNFARTGNPNGGNLVAWPRFDSAADCYLEIKSSPNGSQCGLRTEKSDLWDSVRALGR